MKIKIKNKNKRIEIKIVFLISFFSLVVFLLAFNRVVFAAASARVSVLFNKAYNEQNPAEQIKLYREILKLDPENSDAYNNMGVAYKNQGFYDKAIGAYKKALRNPTYAYSEYVYNNIGLVYNIQGEYEKAVAYFKKAIESESTFIKAYNNIGVAYKNKGDFDRAMAAFEKALEIDPKFVPARMNLKKIWRLPEPIKKEATRLERLFDEADTYFEEGKMKEALEAYKEVLQENNDPKVREKIDFISKDLDYQEWYNTGFVHMQNGEWKESYESFTKALELVKDSIEEENVVALQKEVEFRMKKEEATSQNKKLYSDALDLYNNKKWNDALDIYKRIFTLDTNFLDVREKISECEANYFFENGMKKVEKGDALKAKGDFERVLVLFPNHIGAKEQIDKIQDYMKAEEAAYLIEEAQKVYSKKNYKKSEELFAKVLTIDKNNATALSAIREIQEIAQKKKMKTSFSKITANFLIVGLLVLGYFLLTKLPQMVKIKDHYREYKDFDKARVMYEEILKKEPSRRAIYHPLASLYKKLRQSENIDKLVEFAKREITDTDSGEVPLWYVCLGDIFKERENLKAAVEYFEKACVLLPGNHDVRKKLTTTYEDVLFRESDDSQTRFKLAELYKHQGKLDMAVAEFEMVSNDPNVGEKAKILMEECLSQLKPSSHLHIEKQKELVKVAENEQGTMTEEEIEKSEEPEKT